MTYSVLEASAYSGNAVELYEFQHGVEFWRYTSADEDHVHSGKTFERAAITRTPVDESFDLNRDYIEVTVPRDNLVADLFRLYPPDSVVTLKIWRKHRDDLEAQPIWIGRVLNGEWRGGEAVLRSESVNTSIRRNALRRMYQRSCPLTVYGAACRLNAEMFKVLGVVASVAGGQIQIASAGGYASGYFAGGYLTWQTLSGNTDTRMIVEHSGSAVTVLFPPQTLAVGAAVSLYPGCDHTLSTCKNTFQNALNYGGYPYIPLKNPFGLTTLY